MPLLFNAKHLAFLALAAFFPAACLPQAAPELNLTNPVNIGPDPQTATGMGMSSAVFNSTIYVAFKANNGPTIWIESSPDGVNYTDPGNHYTDFQTNFAPSLATFNGKLFLAYTTTSGGIDVASSTDGITFSLTGTYVPSGNGLVQNVTSPPTLVVFDGQLYLFWEDDDQAGSLNQNSIQSAVSSDGSGSFIFGGGYGSNCDHFQGPSDAPHALSGAAVGAAVFNDVLYVATLLGSGSADSNELSVCAVPGPTNLYPLINPGSGISATVYNGSLYLAFKYNHSDNMLELTGTEDGINFNQPVVSYGNIRIFGSNQVAPSITVFNDELFVFSAANDKDVQMEHSY